MTMPRPIYNDATIEKIVQMQSDGLTDKEIAKAIGTTDKRLASRVSQLGIARYPRDRLQDKRTRVCFTEALITKYRPPAEKRGMTPPELIRVLIDRIAKDNLFEAVLDDGE